MDTSPSKGCLAVAIGLGVLGTAGLAIAGIGLIGLATVLATSGNITEAPVEFVDGGDEFVPEAENHEAAVGSPEPAVRPGPASSPARPRSSVVVNGRSMTPAQVTQFTQMYGTPPQSGNWWYDPRSGQIGRVGEPVFGVLQPGHEFGPLAANASNGTSGVYLNGRQLPAVEVSMYGLVLGPIGPGRYWLDAQGNVGREGQPAVANLIVAAQAAGMSNGGGSPADRWLSGNEWEGEARIGGMPMTSGTWDTSGEGNHVISVGGKVLNLPPY